MAVVSKQHTMWESSLRHSAANRQTKPNLRLHIVVVLVVVVVVEHVEETVLRFRNRSQEQNDQGEDGERVHV